MFQSVASIFTRDYRVKTKRIMSCEFDLWICLKKLMLLTPEGLHRFLQGTTESKQYGLCPASLISGFAWRNLCCSSPEGRLKPRRDWLEATPIWNGQHEMEWWSEVESKIRIRRRIIRIIRIRIILIYPKWINNNNKNKKKTKWKGKGQALKQLSRKHVSSCDIVGVWFGLPKGSNAKGLHCPFFLHGSVH